MREICERKNYEDHLDKVRKEVEKENMRPIRLVPLAGKCKNLLTVLMLLKKEFTKTSCEQCAKRSRQRAKKRKDKLLWNEFVYFSVKKKTVKKCIFYQKY